MKKYFKAICILLVTVMLCACSKPQLNDYSESTPLPQKDVLYIGKPIYDMDNVTLSIEEINHNGIIFACQNNTDKEYHFILNVALDGVVAHVYSDVDGATVAPNEEKRMVFTGTIEEISHSKLSVSGVGFLNGMGELTFDICDFEIGGEYNPVQLPSGECIYETPDLIVEYLGPNAQGIQYKVTNHNRKSIVFGADTFKINSEEQDYGHNVVEIPGHSEDIYTVNILGFNQDYFVSDLQSFEGVLSCRIGGTFTDRFRVSFGETETKPIEQNDDGQQETNDIPLITEPTIEPTTASTTAGFSATGYNPWSSTTGSSTAPTSPPTTEPTSPPTTEPTTPPTTVPTTKPVESKLTTDEIVAFADKQMKKEIGRAYHGYSIESSGSTTLVVFDICPDDSWQSYMIGGSDWRSLTNAADDYTYELRKLFKDNGHSDWHAVVSVLNDLDTSRYLYMSVDGSEYS